MHVYKLVQQALGLLSSIGSKLHMPALRCIDSFLPFVPNGYIRVTFPPKRAQVIKEKEVVEAADVDSIYPNAGDVFSLRRGSGFVGCDVQGRPRKSHGLLGHQGSSIR